jgi:hypothetical protein
MNQKIVYDFLSNQILLVIKARTKVSCGREWNSGLDLGVLLRAGPLRARLAKNP